jgi:hypothetical protein
MLQFPATSREPYFYTRPTPLENKISSPLKRILLTDEQGRRTSLYPLLYSQRILYSILTCHLIHFRSSNWTLSNFSRKVFLQRSLCVVIQYFLYAGLFNDFFLILVSPFLLWPFITPLHPVCLLCSLSQNWPMLLNEEICSRIRIFLLRLQSSVMRCHVT